MNIHILHILENRIKEIRLKLKQDEEKGAGRLTAEPVQNDEENCTVNKLKMF